jgi:leucyl-tRNA synthetase
MRDLGMITNDEPVERLFTQGMVIKDGAKMSKSLGNVVSPDEMVARYGADAARMNSLFAAPPDRDLDWQDSGVEGIQRFLGRVYRFVRDKAKPEDPAWRQPLPASLGGSARSLQRKLHQTIKRVSDDFQGRWHFNTCIAAIMELLNDANRRVLGSGPIQNPSTGASVEGDVIPLTLIADVQRNLVLLLAPFAPYLAHELWEILGETGSLLKAQWPKYDAALAKEEEVEWTAQVNGKLRSVLVVPANITVPVVDELVLADEKVKKATAGQEIVRVVTIPGRQLSNVVTQVISTTFSPPQLPDKGSSKDRS